MAHHVGHCRGSLRRSGASTYEKREFRKGGNLVFCYPGKKAVCFGEAEQQ
jgi:hypothetical protein